MELPKRPSGRYAYLAIFNDLKWLPVAWTTVRGKRVVFQNMGKQVVYLPVGYSQEEGMISMDNSLLALYRQNVISKDTAIIYSSNTELMEKK